MAILVLVILIWPLQVRFLARILSRNLITDFLSIKIPSVLKDGKHSGILSLFHDFWKNYLIYLFILYFGLTRLQIKNKSYPNTVLCLFKGIQVFINKTDIVNIYPAESTWTFLRHLTFYCHFKSSYTINLF